MSCAQCGEPLPEGARFCGQCGARQEPGAEPAGFAPVAAPSPAPGAPLIGRTIAGRYRLLRLVGEGGMGSVYEAEQTLGSSVRSVAVKLLRPEWSHDPAVQARFHREAATVARLEHFNTVRVYDFGATEDGTLFIVMEYLQGQSLQGVLDANGPLPPERVLHIAEQVAASLEEAHGLGIVHRDLKPDNILLLDSYASQHDVVKIVDFGIAKGQPALGSTTKLTELGAFVGTPAYMSPEQFTGGSVGPRSDIYALGITTYQMLAGRLPFAAQSVVEWAKAHVESLPPPLEEQYGSGPIPESMRRAVARALSKSPSDRQGSALELARELSGRGPAVSPGVPRAEQAARHAERALAAALAPSGGMKTAPMTELPDLGAGGERHVPATQAMAAGARAIAAAAPPAAQRGGGSRVLVTLFGALALLTGLALVFVALGGERYLAWHPSQPDVAPPPLRSTTPAEPAPVEPAAPPSASEPRAPEPVEQLPRRPERAAPAPRPSRPAPEPSSAPPQAGPPRGTGGTGSVQLPPLLPSGGAGGTVATPLPSPSAPAAPAPLPQLPWSLPTAGACERCVQALRAGGNYTVVTAVAESLLCEDRSAREACERQIGEVAPGLAEQAARAGDCTAALATAAAAVNVRVPPERFLAVNALCLR